MTEEQEKRRKEYLRNYKKDNYEFWKSRNMCGRCGNKDAYTMRGRVLCAECVEKYAQRRRDNSEHYKKNRRDRYERLKSEHKCVCCGVQLPNDRKATLCEKCYQKQYSKTKIKRKLNRKSSRNLGDICNRCNKNKKMDGKKLCVSCYKKTMKALAKAEEAKKAKGLNEYWRRDNQVAFQKGEIK